MVIDKVSQSVPSESIEPGKLDLPGDIPLADLTPDRSTDVDGLIGAQLSWNLLREERVNLVDKLIQLRNIELDWIVTGETVTKKQPYKANCNVTLKAQHE